MPFLQLVIEVPGADVARAEDACTRLGAMAIALADAADEPLLEPPPGETPLWRCVRLRALFDMSANPGMVAATVATVLGLAPAAMRIEHVQDRDWEREWLRDVRPMRFGQRLWVCPAGLRPERPAPVILELDPGLAFGTGTHATTALCLEWLEAEIRGGERVLDYGCGSGVLALAALALGADRAAAVDIDPQALRATRQNAAKNGFAGRIEIMEPAAHVARQYDAVVANILAGPLIELAPRLAPLARPGGAIVLAGMLTGQAGEVAQAYRAWFDIAPAAEREGWSLLVGRRRAE